MPYLISPTYTTRLSRRFHVDTAYTVIKLPDGTYVNTENFKYDDPRWAGALAVYLGGRYNPVDQTEADLLFEAGYELGDYTPSGFRFGEGGFGEGTFGG